jgi:hypothetical protein
MNNANIAVKAGLAFIALALSGCFPYFVRTISDPIGFTVLHMRTGNADTIRLLRVVSDFNNDGFEDMAVSDSLQWDYPEGTWKINLGTRERRYRFSGSIFCNIEEVYIEPLDKGTARIATYASRGKRKESLIEYQLSAAKLSKIARKRSSFRHVKKMDIVRKGCNLFRENIESCPLSAYLKSRNCLWKRGIPARSYAEDVPSLL